MNYTRLQPEALYHLAEALKALAHPLRLRILEELSGGECSVGDLQKRLEAPQAIVSQQLKIMRTSGVATFRRERNQSLYRLRHPGLLKLLKCLLSCQSYCLTPDPLAEPQPTKPRRTT